MVIQIVTNLPALPEAIGGLVAALPQTLLATIQQAAEVLRERIISGKLSGSPLKTRSGALKESLSAAVSQDGVETTGVVGTSVRYARIQEFGGTIIARGGANLTIPLAGALDSGGQARFSAREVIANPALGGFGGTFVRKHILFGSLAGGAIAPLFKLQPSVEIPARSFMGAALAENRDAIIALIVRGLEELV